MACLKICVDTNGIGSFIENIMSLLILAGAGYVVCLHPWETFWWLFDGLTWLAWWIIKLGAIATIFCFAGCVVYFCVEEKWHQRFPKKTPDPV